MTYCFKFLTSSTVILLARLSSLAETVSSSLSDFFGFRRLKQDSPIRHRLKGIANIIETKLHPVKTTISNKSKFLSFIISNINYNGGFSNAF